jgi:2',3'-cyclic-nucleotide 2'-phosphodiesterase (5'-nucleotidase family)
MVEYFRQRDKSVLLLDGGALFSANRDAAEFILKAMEVMKYDALNLGSSELQWGKEFLEQSSLMVSFPYISSNLLYAGSKIPSIREYIIKEAGGIKVAILGILDPDALDRLPHRERHQGWEAVPPEVALRRLLPEVRKKADLVVLLSQLSIAGTLALTEAAGGIDLAISSGSRDILNPPATKNTVILNAESQGKALGLVKVALDEKLVPHVTEKMAVPLTASVPDHEAIARLLETYKKEQGVKKEKQQQELRENLKLTPEQFMELYRKEQIEQNKGDAK